jgi:hypothetical protein
LREPRALLRLKAEYGRYRSERGRA